MGAPRYITGANLPELRERIPRPDHQARVVFRTFLLLGEHGIGNLVDLARPTHMHHDESRLGYVRRRAQERNELLERQVGTYILKKGLGTEETRETIRHQQRRRI